METLQLLSYFSDFPNSAEKKSTFFIFSIVLYFRHDQTQLCGNNS
jgi:hypothetical protein